MRFGTLSYMNRRGAGVCLRGPLPELAEKLKTLRCKATLRADGSDEPIGGIERADGQDDQRIKWNCWCDTSAVNA